MNKKTVGIYTLGCRLNIYESDGILQKFLENGYEYTSFKNGPDIAIINTCTVTAQADAKNRNIIRQVLKKNPEAKVIVTGCYAQTDRESIASIPGVWAVIGNEYKNKIFDLYQELSEKENKTIILSSGPLKLFENSKKRKVIEDSFLFSNVIPIEHTRAYLKIQDGCDRKCTYCKIPMARGGGISRPIEEILKEVELFEEKRIPEIVLTGVNIGWYRYKNYRFINLLEKILEKLKYSRLRISSIEPSDVNEELAKISLHPKFCNFLHIPLQSGSDRILRLMKRSYSSKTYKLRVEKLIKHNPNVFLGTDVIVGFPTETFRDFLETIKLIKDLNITNIHAFPFSQRSGTEIEKFINENPGVLIPKNIIKKRIKILNQLKSIQYIKYINNNYKNIFEAIIENIDNEYLEVITDNYLYIKIKRNLSKKYQKGQFLKVKITNYLLNEELEIFGEEVV